MRKLLLIVVVAALCGGCVYQDLKAPCADKLASLNEVPCDNRQPVNLAFADLGWSYSHE